MIGWAEFYLTDGTNRINLLEANQRIYGIGVEKVRFSRPQKNTESIFSQRYKTVQETYAIKVVGASQDSAILDIRALEAMLLQADNYFNTTTEINPIWLVSRAYKETSRRYALVLGGQVPEYADIYQAPFVSTPGTCVMDELDLQITRTAWMANPPNAPKDITATNLKNWPTNQPGQFYASNHFTDEAIISIKHFDASSSTYTTVSPIPYPGGAALLPAVPAASDLLYIGFAPKAYGTSILPGAIYVNATQNGGNITSIVWEFWNGATWVTATNLIDSWSRGPSGSIVLSLEDMDATWAATTVNAVNAMWIRMRVTAVAGGPTPPRANLIYTLRNFVEFNTIKGDIPALLDLRIESHQQGMSTGNATYELYMGLRSTDRGSVFYPWLPPLNVAASANVDSYKYIVTGNHQQYQATTSWATPVKYNLWGRNIGGVISKTSDYYGQYRAFLRIGYVGTATDRVMRLAYRDESPFASGNLAGYTKEVAIVPFTAANAQPAMYDMGVITIGGNDLATVGERGGYYSLYLQIKADVDTVDMIDIYDMMLLPIDEWCCHVTDTDPTTVGLWYNLVGSASFFKKQIRAINYDPNFQTQILRSLQVEASGPAQLTPGKTQRLYFLGGGRLSTGQLICRPEMAWRIYANTQEQFLGMRGNG